MPFADLPVSQYSVNMLKKILAKGRFSGTFLIYGPPCLGKLEFAVSSVKAFFCLNAENDFCNKCSNCTRIVSRNFPDLTVIKPDGAFIKIEQLREMQQMASLMPYESDKRIFIIDNADKMRQEAANCLLKTLEEPASFSVFILTTSKQQAILPTILSRCQKIRLSELSTDAIFDILMKESLNEQKSKEKVMLASRMSNGRIQKARALLSSDLSGQRIETFNVMKKIISGNDADVFLTASSVIDKMDATGQALRDKVIEFLGFLRYLTRDAIFLLSDLDENYCVNKDIVDNIRDIFNSINVDSVIRLIELIDDAEQRILGNANVQNTLEMLFLEYKEVRRPQPVK